MGSSSRIHFMHSNLFICLSPSTIHRLRRCVSPWCPWWSVSSRQYWNTPEKWVIPIEKNLTYLKLVPSKKCYCHYTYTPFVLYPNSSLSFDNVGSTVKGADHCKSDLRPHIYNLQFLSQWSKNSQSKTLKSSTPRLGSFWLFCLCILCVCDVETTNLVENWTCLGRRKSQLFPDFSEKVLPRSRQVIIVPCDRWPQSCPVTCSHIETVTTGRMWDEGLVNIEGDRAQVSGKYVVAKVDIPQGNMRDWICWAIKCSLRHWDTKREASGSWT